MRIAIDHSPLVSTHKLAHKIRGTGFYIKNLIDSLKKYHPEHEYVLFTQGQRVQGIDVFHFPYFEPFFISLPFLKQGKTVVTIHDLTPLVFPDLFPSGVRGKIKYRLQKILVKGSDAVITDSNSSRDDIERILQIDNKKIHTVPLAASDIFKQLDIKTSTKTKILTKYNIPSKFILYVGDATPNKNLKRLIDAVVSSGIPLVMVGMALAKKVTDTKNPWNQDLVYVQEMASKATNIHIIGYVSDEDLVLLYNMARAFVFPSFYEGFGLPLLEAAACGTPIVTTQGGSIPEVIGTAALFIDPFNTESIAHGIEKIFEDQKLCQELSKKGIMQESKFSWEKVAHETVQVYEEISK